MIRDATDADLPGILEIYNDVIASSTAVYADDPVPLSERRQWLEARRALGYPVLVAADDGRVLGFASFGDFRAWPGYRHSCEHSVHVRRGCRGAGVGRRLVEGLFPRAEALGKHVMLAAVDADNAASILFHERLGFERVGHFREVGYKFGRWLDLVFLQRFLGSLARP